MAANRIKFGSELVRVYSVSQEQRQRPLRLYFRCQCPDSPEIKMSLPEQHRCQYRECGLYFPTLGEVFDHIKVVHFDQGEPIEIEYPLLDFGEITNPTASQFSCPGIGQLTHSDLERMAYHELHTTSENAQLFIEAYKYLGNGLIRPESMNVKDYVRDYLQREVNERVTEYIVSAYGDVPMQDILPQAQRYSGQLSEGSMINLNEQPQGLGQGDLLNWSSSTLSDLGAEPLRYSDVSEEEGEATGFGPLQILQPQKLDHTIPLAVNVPIQTPSEPMQLKMETTSSYFLQQPGPTENKPVAANKLRRMTNVKFESVDADAENMELENGVNGYYSKKFILDVALSNVVKIKDEANAEGCRPYICPIPGCSKAYKNANGIRYHAATSHKGPLNLTCATCGQVCKTMQGLASHRTRHVKKEQKDNGVYHIQIPERKRKGVLVPIENDSGLELLLNGYAEMTKSPSKKIPVSKKRKTSPNFENSPYDFELFRGGAGGGFAML